MQGMNQRRQREGTEAKGGLFMSLLQNQLASLKTGTRVEITYAGRKEFCGLVSDNDQTYSLKITSEEKDLLYVCFSEITSLLIPAAAESGYQTNAPQTGTGKNHVITSLPETVTAKETPAQGTPGMKASTGVTAEKTLSTAGTEKEAHEPDYIPFYRTELVKKSYADRELNAMLESLPRKEKKALAPYYYNFQNVLVKGNDSQITQAAGKLKDQIEKQGINLVQALYLAAAMQTRAHNRGAAARFLHQYELYEDAALEFHFAGNPTWEGISSIQALIFSEEVKNPDTLFTILEYGIKKSRDISVLGELWMWIPEKYKEHLKALLTYLAERFSVELAKPDQIRECFDQLLIYYPDATGMRSVLPGNLKELLAQSKKKKEGDASKPEQNEKIPEAVTGLTTKNSAEAIEEKGTVQSELHESAEDLAEAGKQEDTTKQGKAAEPESFIENMQEAGQESIVGKAQTAGQEREAEYTQEAVRKRTGEEMPAGIQESIAGDAQGADPESFIEEVQESAAENSQAADPESLTENTQEAVQAGTAEKTQEAGQDSFAGQKKSEAAESSAEDTRTELQENSEEKNTTEKPENKEKQLESEKQEDSTAVHENDTKSEDPHSESGENSDEKALTADGKSENEKEEGKETDTVSAGPEIQPVFTPPSDIHYGILTSVSWIQNRGNIEDYFDGLTYSFSYENVTDRNFREELTTLTNNHLASQKINVQYVVANGDAAQVRQESNSVNLAEAMMKKNAECEVLIPVFRCLAAVPPESISLRCLELLLGKAAAYGKKYSDKSINSQVRTILEANMERLGRDEKLYDAAIEFYSAAGETTKALRLMKTLLSSSNLTAYERLERRLTYISLLRSAYGKQKNKDYLETILAQVEAFAADYEQAGYPAMRNPVCNHFHRYDSYLTMAECYLLLGDLKKAKQSIDRFPAETVDEEDSKRLETIVMSLQEAIRRQTEEEEEKRRKTEEEEKAEQGSLTHKDDAAGKKDGLQPARQDEAGEEPYIYKETERFEALKLSKKEIINYALSAKAPGRLAVLLTYLKAGKMLYPPVEPVYRAASLAVNNPMEEQDYSTETLLTYMGQIDTDYAEFSDYCLAAAVLRSAFSASEAYSYNLNILHDSVTLFREIPALETLFYQMAQFRQEYEIPLDELSAYHGFDNSEIQEAKRAAAISQARAYYQQFFEGSQKNGSGIRRLAEAKQLIYAQQGPIGTPIRMIAEGNFEALSQYKTEFTARWIEGNYCIPQALKQEAVLNFIEECWNQVNSRSKGFKLQGQRLNNVRSNITKLLSFVCECCSLISYDAKQRNENTVRAYQHISAELIQHCDELSAYTKEEESRFLAERYPQKAMGLFVLGHTAKELRKKMDGSWDERLAGMCFSHFLASDYILLKDDFMPDLEGTFLSLPEFNILYRIRRAAETDQLSLTDHLLRIYQPDPSSHNFGTAELILQYLAAKGKSAPLLPVYAGDCVEQASSAMKAKVAEFRRKYALAIAVGQISHGNEFLENAENMIRYWWDTSEESLNYGFLYQLMEQTYKYIHEEASKRQNALLCSLDHLTENYPEQVVRFPQAPERIRNLIYRENFSVAEDVMKDLREGVYFSEQDDPAPLGYLKEFWRTYDMNYRLMSNLSTSVQNLFSRSSHNKEQRGALGLVDNWIKGGTDNGERIERLLTYLGWTNIVVKRKLLPGNAAEVYHVSRETETGGRTNAIHRIAPFGSMLDTKGFEVICLYGSTDSTSLLEKIAALDSFQGGARLILLDGVLSMPERRSLARKIKKRDRNYFHTYLVLDRVLLCYLHDNYKGSVINRMLMSAGMPFAWYQPYVADSGNYMSPEMFIGRTEELRRIEGSSADQADSVNLIYGGRQLGKTALLKKAFSDVDRVEDRRAVYVDLINRNSQGAARAFSQALADAGILPENAVTPEWDILIDAIRGRMRQDAEPIRYLLVMLDEADDFIKDIARERYYPIVELKKLQEAMPDRFKFVIAGTHDIVRFHRASALSENTGIPHLKSLPVKPFSKQEAFQLLKEPLAYLGFVIEDDDQATQIVAQTNYFPGLIQLYCQKLVDSLRNVDYGGFTEADAPPYRVSNDLIGRVLADNHFIFEIRKKFEMTIELEKMYYLIALLLCHLSYDSPKKIGYTVKDIFRAARELDVKSFFAWKEEQVDAFLDELCDLNMLRRESPHTYAFASDNFRYILGSDSEILDRLIEVEAEEEGGEEE